MKILLSWVAAFAASTLLFVICNGQETTPQKSPLQLTIKLEKSEICRSDDLVINATITNRSRGPKIIDTEEIFSSMTFSSIRMVDDRMTSENQTQLSEGGGSPQYLILVPGESHIFRRDYNLGKPFFKYDVEYSLIVNYRNFAHATFGNRSVWRGSVESNKIKFSVRSCNENDDLLVRNSGGMERFYE